MKRLNAAVLALTGLLATLLADSAVLAQVKLESKVPPNQQWTVKTWIKTDQTLTLAGRDIITAGEQEITTQMSSGPRGNDGTIPVKQKIVKLTAELSLPGGVELQFDSAKPDAPPPGTPYDVLLKVFKVLSTSEWTQIYNAEGRIVDIKGQDEILSKLDENLKPLLERQFDPSYLKEQSNNELNKLPDHPVKKGDTWKRESTVRLEGGQQMKFTAEFEYLGTVDQGGRTLDKIGSKALDVSYSIDQDAPTPLRATGSDLKIAESQGIILFDRARGMFVESSDKMQITGTIDFVVQGMELKGELDLAMDTKMKQE